MRKPLNTRDLTTDEFINDVESKKSRGRPKKATIATKSTLSQTQEDISRRDDLVDCVSNIKDANGRRLVINYSEAARLGYECAIYLAKNDNNIFTKLINELKIIR